MFICTVYISRYMYKYIYVYIYVLYVLYVLHVFMFIYIYISPLHPLFTPSIFVYIWLWINTYTLYIPFLVGWTSIYQLFWCSPGVQGFDTLPYIYIHTCICIILFSDAPWPAVHLQTVRNVPCEAQLLQALEALEPKTNLSIRSLSQGG